MRKVMVEIELFDRGDLVLTPDGEGVVGVTEETPTDKWQIYGGDAVVVFPEPRRRLFRHVGRELLHLLTRERYDIYRGKDKDSDDNESPEQLLAAYDSFKCGDDS